jgi:hypothetical protein
MDLTQPHVEQHIPKKSNHIDTFVDSTISLMTEDAIQQCETLAMHSHDVKTPFFLVSKGEHNYIYSFHRIVEGLEAEIKSRKDFFEKQLFISASPLIISVFVMIMSYFDKVDLSKNAFLMVGILLACGVYCTAQAIYRNPFKAIKKLKAIKRIVFGQSQSYLSELAEEAKRPVIII